MIRFVCFTVDIEWEFDTLFIACTYCIMHSLVRPQDASRWSIYKSSPGHCKARPSSPSHFGA